MEAIKININFEDRDKMLHDDIIDWEMVTNWLNENYKTKIVKMKYDDARNRRWEKISEDETKCIDHYTNYTFTTEDGKILGVTVSHYWAHCINQSTLRITASGNTLVMEIIATMKK